MKTLSAISKVLLANNIDKKLTKRRTDYLLGVLALAALPHEAIASKETPQTVDIKGYLVDVAKLAEAAGIEITDIDQVALALDDVTLGELIYLGNGVYQFIPTEGVSGGVSFVISGSGASQAVTVVASFDQATAMDGGIVAFVGFDVSDYQSSLPEFSYSSAKSDSDSSSDEGSSFGGAGYGLAALAAGVGMAMGSSSEDESTETVDGVILDGYLSNAQVFLDANSNGNLDWTDSITVNGQWDAGEGEQWTLSGVDGSYSLENVATSDIASGTLVGRAYKIDSVSQTVDMVSGSSVDNIVLKADASATVITPITTLIEAGVEETLILEVLGLSEAEADVIGSINSYDPFADEIANSLDATVTDAALAYGKVAAQVFTSINAIAEAVDSAADTTAADEVFVTAITQLAEIIEEEVLVREENTLIEAQAVALQAIVDAAGAEATDDQINAVAEARATKTAEIEVDLADSTVIQEVATQTISVVDAITGNSEVADNFAYNATLAADIYQAVANINEQIDSIVEFNEDATATLSIGADALVDQVKEAVEKEVLTKEVAELDEIIASGDAEDQAVIDAQTAKSEKETELTSIGDAKITLAADTFVSFYESSSALHTQFDVEGTDSNSTVDATGTYGDLQNNGGGEWLYVAHTANDHGRSQNDGDTYTEHFVITDDNATTHEVTVVVYGANDSAVISADSPAEAIVEGDTDSDVTVSGVASHTDIDGDNADDTFTAVTDVATTYGAYSVTAGGAWTYTLNSTNATIDALGQGQSTSDTVTVTAEDGTTKDITIAINGTNDAADITVVDSSVSENNTVVESSNVISSENVFQLNGSQAILNDYDPSSDTDIQKIITMSSYGSTLFAENTTSLNLGNLLNAANNSQEFQAQTISFELAKIPTGSGSGTVGIDLIDGSDEIVDSGERFAHLDINVDWSADGDSAQFTVPSQTVSGFYITSAGSQIDFTIENAEPDMISVTHNGANYPASIDLKFASIIDSLEGVGSVSLLEAGTYSVALTTDLPIVDSSGTHIDTIASVVEITNDASVELISSGSTFADSTVSGTVTHTDVDANNADDAFTAVADIATTFGAYSVTTGGAWTYTLNNNIATIDELGVGQSVTDIVTVTAEDGTTKDITITINGINDSAFVSGDFGDFIVENDVDVSGTLYHTDIDANNADDTFTAVADVATTYGTYSVTTGGAWTYTLDNNNAAINSLTDSDEVADTFVVTAEDGTAEDVMIQIIGANDAPTSSPISDVVVDEDVALDALDVTSYFADVDAGDTLSYTADFGEGSMVLADGIVPGNTFDNDGVGVHNVTITATDSSNVTASESFTITVNNVNDAAVITAADGTIAEGDATVSGSATHTDVDANNADDTFTAVTDVATTYGTYSVTAGGAWTYTLNNENAAIDALAASASLADTITVTAEDGTTKDVTITITGVNDAPVGVADSLTISEDAAATVISVLSNDTDAEDSALSVVFKTAGSNGTVVNVGDGTVTYEPNANFSGSDTFTYIASDGTEQSELTTVTVTVDAVNDPTTGSVTISGDAKTGQVLTASNTLADDDGLGTVTYQWYKDGTEVSDAVNATYTLSDSDIGGVFTVTASHTDDGGTTESADSDATGAVADIDKPFVFNAEVIEASAITTSSIGSYVDNPTEKIIKLTLDVDMARISDDSVNSITAGSLDFVIDWSKVEAISYLSGAYQDMYIEEATPVTATSFSGDSVAVTTFSGLTYDGSASDTQFNEVLISSIDVSANVPNLTLVDDVDTTPGNPFAAGVDHASSNDLWTFYLNPVDSIDSLDITFGGGVTINEGDSDITQLSYTTTVDIL